MKLSFFPDQKSIVFPIVGSPGGVKKMFDVNQTKFNSDLQRIKTPQNN